jgi:hypothetical protein
LNDRAHSVKNEAARRFKAVKLLHTVVWAGFAGCIVVIPFLAWERRFGAAAVLAAIVLGEVVVLWLHRWSCPLTAVAGATRTIAGEFRHLSARVAGPV